MVLSIPDGQLQLYVDWSPSGKPTGLLTGTELPSASLFKLVTTAALLEAGKVSPWTKLCTAGGEHRLDASHLTAPRTGITRCAPFFDALGYSRNAAYAQLVHRSLSPEDLRNFGDRFHFNAPVPGELPISVGHLTVPEEPLALVRTATGFENVTLSPIGAAYIGLVIARGGLEASVTQGTSQAVSESLVPRVLQEKTAATLRSMMQVTVTRGTAAAALHAPGAPRPLPPELAAKTGTLGVEEGAVSWFLGLTREQVVVVVLDNGVVWRQKAVQVAAELLPLIRTDASASPESSEAPVTKPASGTTAAPQPKRGQSEE